MKKFVIVTDSCSDLTRDYREKYDIDYIPMRIIFNGKDIEANLDWEEISYRDFYDLMRNGTRITTAQITTAVYLSAFEKYIKEGYDILSISCSSALSASIHASEAARDELLAKYPESKIICIDSLTAVAALGMLCIRASELRAQGKTIEETAEWVLANRNFVNQECTAESLTYLKRAGRVSAASAFFGGLLSVKPIIISDVNGMNAAVEKVKGRKNSIDRIIERFKDEYLELDYQKVFVVHADCEVEGEAIKKRVEEIVGDKVEVNLGVIGPIIGASVGPGAVAIFFFGKEITFSSTK